MQYNKTGKSSPNPVKATTSSVFRCKAVERLLVFVLWLGSMTLIVFAFQYMNLSLLLKEARKILDFA
jgi:hypothetical protein